MRGVSVIFLLLIITTACSGGRKSFFGTAAMPEGSATPVPTVGPGDDEHLQKPNLPSSSFDYQWRMMDRFYVGSMLHAVFGESASVKTVVTGLVEKQTTGFGGACDFDLDDCEGRRDLSALGAVPSANIMRYGFKTQACNKLVANDDILKIAITRAGIEDLTALVRPTDVDIANAYGLFYVGELPNDVQKTAFMSLVAAPVLDTFPTPALDAWRFLFLTLCLDPGWELQ